MTDTTTLAPCPFCRGTARYLEEKTGFWTERAICDSCGFCLTRTRTESAVTRWNRRAPAPASGDVRSAAQALVDRWDTPKWKDAEHTGAFIQRLRDALAAQAAQEARVPLTEKQISKLWSDAHNDTSDRMAHQVLVRLVEAEHGITAAQKGKHHD